MLGMNLKMTTMTMMFLMVIAISAIMGKETQDDYNKGYHPLRNKQPYFFEEHHQRTPYFPRSRHGYSKPRPKPRDTPCTCKKTFFVPAPELKSFRDHWIAASLMGCTLATGSDKDELRVIRQVAIDYQAVEPNIPRSANGTIISFMWIGLASEPIPLLGNPNFDVGGDFGWLDGCTPYTKNVFFGPPLNARDQSTFDSVYPDFVMDANESLDVGDEHDGAVFLGIIDFELLPGVILPFPLELFDGVLLPSHLPAIYECCVGNKSYRPQTYVLGSPHKSKEKKIVHAQSPYIP